MNLFINRFINNTEWDFGEKQLVTIHGNIVYQSYNCVLILKSFL